MNLHRPTQFVSAELLEPERAAARPADLRDLLVAMRRRIRLILISAMLVAAGVIGVGLMQPRTFTSTATIMISPKQGVVEGQEAETGTDGPVLDSELEILRSPRMAERLVQQLGLDRDPRWNPNAHDAPVAEAPVNAEGDTAATAQDIPPDPGTVARVADAIKAERRGGSYAIDVNVTTSDPLESARIANALIDIYRRFGYESRLESGEATSTWLRGRLDELRLDVQRKEAAVETFRAQSGLLTSGGVSLTERQISDSQTAVLQARTELAEAEARRSQAVGLDGSSSDTIGSVINSEEIRDLRQREAELTRRQAELESSLGPRHPSVISGRAELDNIRQQRAEANERIRDSLNNEVVVARSRLSTLEGNLSRTRTDLVSNNGALVQLNELEREAEATRTVYQSFLQRFQELSDRARIDGVAIRLISAARPPLAPDGPGRSILLLLAIFAGGVVGVGLALLVESLDDTLWSEEEVEKQLGVPPIAAIPLLTSSDLRGAGPGRVSRKLLAAPTRVLDGSDDSADGSATTAEATSRSPDTYCLDMPLSAFAEAFRMLLSSVNYRVNGRSKVLAVTSPNPGDGKTVTALSLGRLSAAIGQRVIYVDCDLRRNAPNRADLTPGLVSVLGGESAWRDAVVGDSASPMHILPAGALRSAHHNLFGGDALQKLIAELREQYDLILFDCAPVLVIAEAKTVSGHADATLVVVRAGKSSSKKAKAAVVEAAALGGDVLGLVLNSAGRQPAATGYYQNYALAK